MNVERLMASKFTVFLWSGLVLLLLNTGVYIFGVARLGHFAQVVKGKVSANGNVLKEIEAEKAQLALKIEGIRNDRRVTNKLAKNVFKTQGSRMVTLQKTLQHLIDSNHLNSKTISYSYKRFPGRKERTSGWEHSYVRVDMQLPLSGPYAGIKGIIHDLQASPQFFVVGALSLSSSTEGGAELNVSLSLSTYFIDNPGGYREAGKKGGKP